MENEQDDLQSLISVAQQLSGYFEHLPTDHHHRFAFSLAAETLSATEDCSLDQAEVMVLRFVALHLQRGGTIADFFRDLPMVMISQVIEVLQ